MSRGARFAVMYDVCLRCPAARQWSVPPEVQPYVDLVLKAFPELSDE